MAATFTAARAEFVSPTDATSYEIVAAGLGAFTPNADSTLVAIILGAETSDATYDLSSFASTGMSLTWTQYGTGTAWTNTQFYRLHVFTAPVGSSPSSVTTATATWNEGILGCDAWIGEWAGVDTTTPIKQSATSDNALGTDPTASLSGAPDSDSSTLFAAITRRNPPGWTPEAGWTEYMDNGVSVPVIGLYVAVTTSGADQTFTSTGTDALNLSFIWEFDAASAVANTVTHTGPNLQFAGGVHAKRTTRAHVGANLALAGGTHLRTLARRIAHTGANLALAAGTHVALKAKVVLHAAANLQLAGGTHLRTLRRSHTAPNFALAGGTHAATLSGPPGSPVDITEVGVAYAVAVLAGSAYLMTVNVGGSLDQVAAAGDYLSPVLPIPGDYDTSVSAAGSSSTTIAIAGSYDIAVTAEGSP